MTTLSYRKAFLLLAPASTDRPSQLVYHRAPTQCEYDAERQIRLYAAQQPLKGVIGDNGGSSQPCDQEIVLVAIVQMAVIDGQPEQGDREPLHNQDWRRWIFHYVLPDPLSPFVPFPGLWQMVSAD